MLWENLREEEFDGAIEKSKGVCVVPIGCLEMHGQHLPVGTDTQTCYYIAKEAAKLEPVVVFPPQYFGDITGLNMWKGGIDLSLELRLRLLDELCSEIARNGFKKIMFLNGHGGNGFLSIFVKSCLHTKKDYMVLTRNDFVYGFSTIIKDLDAGERFPELTDEDIAYIRDFAANKYTWGHGCINETAIMNEINPEAVDMSRIDAVDGKNQRNTGHLTRKRIEINGDCGFWLLNFPNSFAGEHLEGANERIGKVILRKRIEYQAEACRLLKEDTEIFDMWMKNWGSENV